MSLCSPARARQENWSPRPLLKSLPARPKLARGHKPGWPFLGPVAAARMLSRATLPRWEDEKPRRSGKVRPLAGGEAKTGRGVGLARELDLPSENPCRATTSRPATTGNRPNGIGITFVGEASIETYIEKCKENFLAIRRRRHKMVRELENNRMTLKEIRELMELRDWTPTRLAAAMDMSKDAVSRWFSDNHPPKGPASILMRIWLEESRAEKQPESKPSKQLAGAGK